MYYKKISKKKDLLAVLHFFIVCFYIETTHLLINSFLNMHSRYIRDLCNHFDFIFKTLIRLFLYYHTFSINTFTYTLILLLRTFLENIISLLNEIRWYNWVSVFYLPTLWTSHSEIKYDVSGISTCSVLGTVETLDLI